MSYTKMYSVVIADDEQASRKGLVSFVRRCDLPLEVVAEAQNGREALEAVQTHRPDMLLSDIRMPFVDGIGLVESIREAGLSTKVLLVSGYSDVDYLKSAVRLGAIDYLLKPVQPAELIAALRRMFDISEQETVESVEHARRDSLLREAMPLLRERFLSDLVMGEADDTRLAGRIDWLDLSLSTSEPYLAAVIRLRHGPASGNGVQERERMLDELLESARATFAEKLDGVAFRHVREELVALVPVADEAATFSDRLESTLEVFLSEAGAARELLNVGIGLEVPRLVDVSSSYDSACTALSQSLTSESRLFFADEVDGSGTADLGTRRRALQAIDDAIRTGIPAAAESAVRTFFQSMLERPDVDLQLLRGFAIELAVRASITSDQAGGRTTGDPRKLHELLTSLVNAQHEAEVVSTLNESVREAAGRVASRRLSKNEIIVQRIKTFIDAHYADPIGIANIAEELEYTTSHLCNVFKKETGTTINQYLTDVRMKQASEILGDPSLRLYEVAAQVGYNDYKHFASLFRRHFSESPSEHREHVIPVEKDHD